MSGKMMCEICNSEFTPEEIGKNHYIARDSVDLGLTTTTKITECKLYDAFDCPVCKCQNIIGERKQRSNVIVELLENESVKNYFDTIDKGLHDKENKTLCDRCKQQDCHCDCAREFEEKEDNVCFGIVGKESNECDKCVLSYECKKVKHYGCFTKFDAKNYVCKNVCEYSDLCCELHTEGEKK